MDFFVLFLSCSLYTLIVTINIKQTFVAREVEDEIFIGIIKKEKYQNKISFFYAGIPLNIFFFHSYSPKLYSGNSKNNVYVYFDVDT